MKFNYKPKLIGQIQAHNGFDDAQTVGYGRRESGAVMPMVALALVAFIGIVGLVTDFAPVYWDKNKLQNAADAAALSAVEQLKHFPDITDDALKAHAKQVFDAQLPSGSAGLDVNRVEIDRTNSIVRVAADHGRDSALTRVLPDSSQRVNMTVVGAAQLRTVSTTSTACTSALIICGDYPVREQPYEFRMTNDAGTSTFSVLCKDDDKTCNPSSSAENLSEGTFDPNTGSSPNTYCFPANRIQKGLGRGGVKKGVDARFFGEGQAVGGAVYRGIARDLYAYPFSEPGRSMAVTNDLRRPSFGALTYSNYQTQIDAAVNKNAFDAATLDRRTPYQRVLYVANLPSGKCAGNTVNYSTGGADIPVKCLFLRRPVESSSGNDVIYGQIFKDCGVMSKEGKKQIEVKEGRLIE